MFKKKEPEPVENELVLTEEDENPVDTLQGIHEHIDGLRQKQGRIPVSDENIVPHTPGFDDPGLPQDVQEHMEELRQERQKQDNLVDTDTDREDRPEETGATVLKYHKGAEISGKLEAQFDPNVAFFGSHVVNSNTKRLDNLRHLGELDSTRIVRDIPYLREMGTDIKIESTSEFQMCRSNPEIGGFDQKMGRTNITKEDVELRQQQTIHKTGKDRGGGILGIFSRKKET
jgi:hypothetical protein